MINRKLRATAARAGTSAQMPVKSRSPDELREQPHGGALMVGGGPGRGGRPAEAMRRACRQAFAEKGGVEFVAKVMAGEETEDVTVTIGSGKDARTEVVQVRPKLRDRLYAAELLMEHGHGKAPQEVKIEDERPRRTGEEIMAHILELLPRVIAVLPVERKELARLLAERQRIEVLVSGKQVKDGTSGSGDEARSSSAVQ